MRELSSEKLGTDIVTLLVGKKNQKVVLHKKLLCDESEFFSKAFRGEFQKSKENEMALQEDDPQTIDLLVHYLYHDNVPKYPTALFPRSDVGFENFCDQMYTLYEFADKIRLNKLGNMAIDALRDALYVEQMLPSPATIERIYAMTCQNSQLRKLAVLTYLSATATLRQKPLAEEGEDGVVYLVDKCPDFAKDFIRLQALYGYKFFYGGVDPRGSGDGSGMGRCYFHTHGDGETCHLGESKYDGDVSESDDESDEER